MNNKQELFNYLNTLYLRGEDLNQARTQLIQSGWQASDVDEVLASVTHGAAQNLQAQVQVPGDSGGLQGIFSNTKLLLFVAGCLVLLMLPVIFIPLVSSSDDTDGTQNAAQGDEENVDSAESSEEEISTNPLAIAQRDTQRKNDLGRLGALNETFASNNNGRNPLLEEVITEFPSLYFNDAPLLDPASEEPYEFTQDDALLLGQIQYRIGYQCNRDTNEIEVTSSFRAYAYRTLLESGDYHCDGSQYQEARN